jgi:hypothetical protein
MILSYIISSILLDTNTFPHYIFNLSTSYRNTQLSYHHQTPFTMDKAKAAVSSFLTKDGKHNTTVHETVNPAIQHEKVNPTHHENITTAVDKEVHQDHYHTSVQPIQHKEVLPEEHKHKLGAVEHKTVNHGNDDHVRQRLEAEKAQFNHTRDVGETQHTKSVAPVVMGEHVHHHVHENIQPVVQKETIQPHVTHTTVPVHEVHQNEAKHHNATQLPPVTMEDFKRQGGHLGGREQRTDAFVGEPRAVGGTLGGHGARGTTSLTESEGGHNHGIANGSHTSHQATNGTHDPATGTHKKVSLIDKINPKVDSDGDGVAGFMK